MRKHLSIDTEENLGNSQRKHAEALMAISQSSVPVPQSLSLSLCLGAQLGIYCHDSSPVKIIILRALLPSVHIFIA